MDVPEKCFSLHSTVTRHYFSIQYSCIPLFHTFSQHPYVPFNPGLWDEKKKVGRGLTAHPFSPGARRCPGPRGNPRHLSVKTRRNSGGRSVRLSDRNTRTSPPFPPRRHRARLSRVSCVGWSLVHSWHSPFCFHSALTLGSVNIIHQWKFLR